MTDAREEAIPVPECPTPGAHDRFNEAHWQLHQMVANYHKPMLFRYCANAFVNALKSTTELLVKELEQAGHNEWRKRRYETLKADPLFAAFARGRNIVLHQRPLMQNSQVQMAYFKFGRIRLAVLQDLKTDETSDDLLARLRRSQLFFGTSDRPAIGEQLGIRRLYFEPVLSVDEDVLTASNRAWSLVGDLLREAHELLGMPFNDHDPNHLQAHDVEGCQDLLETDVDPSIASNWD